jgi:hypothetical protein
MPITVLSAGQKYHCFQKAPMQHAAVEEFYKFNKDWIVDITCRQI